MSTDWATYLSLLDEVCELPELEKRGRNDADAAYNAEAKRLEVALASAQRDLTSLKERNSRLQIGVRDLVRSLGLTLPAGSSDSNLTMSQLDDAIRSAERDLDQLRTSLTHLRRQQSAQPPPPPPPPPSSAQPPLPTTRSEQPSGSKPPLVLAIAAACAVIVIILLVVLL